MSRVVWYVSYGSNMSRDRLLKYLTGGRAGSRTSPGARDSSPPTGDRVVEIPGGLWFGGESERWLGGVAHLDQDSTGMIVGRAWRLTAEQVCDIAAQESHLAPGSVVISPESLPGGCVWNRTSRYGRVVPATAINDEPGCTLTFVDRPDPNPPSVAYLRLIVSGLRECGLGEIEILTYLTGQRPLSTSLVRRAMAATG